MKRPNTIDRTNCTTYGTGPERTICLFMEKDGLGDDLHAMPAVCQLVKDGYDVHIYTHEWKRPFWEACGAHWHLGNRYTLNMSFVPQNQHLYGRMISLNEWSVWQDNELGYTPYARIEQFAELVDSPLPEQFSWIDTLRPEKQHGVEYVVFAPESSSVWRAIPDDRAKEIYRALVDRYTYVTWLTTRERTEHTFCSTWHELSNEVYNATLVVAAENGIANLAAAYERPVNVLCGPTEPTHILGQFRTYVPVRYNVTTGFEPEGCTLPCYFEPSKGMRNVMVDKVVDDEVVQVLEARCAGKYAEPFCLKTISIEQILQNTHFA